jgi:hypothetical protein
MDKEEREFLRLQTDVQILLAISLAFFALTGAFLIAYAQLRNDILLALTVVLGIMGIVLVLITFYARTKLDEPKGRE